MPEHDVSEGSRDDPEGDPGDDEAGGELPGVQPGPVCGDDREQAGEGKGYRGGSGGDGGAPEALAEGGGCGGAEDDAGREGRKVTPVRSGE